MKIDGVDLGFSIMKMTAKIIGGIFIGAIVLPLKLLESRVEPEGEYIESSFNEDQL